MNDVALATNVFDFLEAYAAKETNAIVGTLLKFSKGDWIANDKEIPPNTKMVADLDQLQIGWVRWSDNKPIDQVMAHILKMEKPAVRTELGDDDQSLWERDPSTNKPRDPWQNTAYLVLKNPTDGALYTFATSSYGGRGAVSDLLKAYGTAGRMRPKEWPVVALRVDSYPHTTFGKIKVPVLAVVGWAPKADASVGAEPYEDPEYKTLDAPQDIATATRF